MWESTECERPRGLIYKRFALTHAVFNQNIISSYIAGMIDPENINNPHKPVADPGFPRGGGTNPLGGANIRFCQIFPKSA